MENFELNANYIYSAVDLQNNTYYLHVITNTDQANYRAGNQSSVVLQNNGKIDVELQVIKDSCDFLIK